MNTTRSLAIVLSGLMACVMAALPVPAAAQIAAQAAVTAATDKSLAPCPQGATDAQHGVQPSAVVCKHAILTKGTGGNRSPAPTAGSPVKGPLPDLDGDAHNKTGHVTINR